MSADNGMVSVNRAEFYRIMAPLDVTPYPQGPWDDAMGYRTPWKDRYGNVLGIEHGEQYIVQARLVQSHARDSLEK